MTAPEKRMPGGSRANAGHTTTDTAILPPTAEKRFARLAALYALQGWCLWRSDSADGPVVFHAARWNRTTPPMRDLDQVEQLLQRIAGPGAC